METTLHDVRDCCFLSGVWRSILPRDLWSSFFSSTEHEWLTWNLQDEGNITIVEGGLFSIICWSLANAKRKTSLESNQVTSKHWQVLPEGWVKLNPDGFLVSHLSHAAIGRDSRFMWRMVSWFLDESWSF
ncbi:hypothetical protein J1N35_008858 [Gossypium stocksii]|uniref:Uncharacterized protein n=1 Tax=Gossypium stocksii TaxID=47602 RepID=A0A9D3WBM4_9ROSI|nr:hypothetical protein J1N35_008858 [Gossypium stocksii]